MARLAYKPIGLLVSVLGTILASVVFKRVWKAVAHDHDAPEATDERRGWPKVVAAATVHGAVFGGIKAAIDRAGATGFAKATGSWPGPKEALTRRRRRAYPERVIEISCAACGWVAITAQPVNAVWREHEEGCSAVGGAVRFMPDLPPLRRMQPAVVACAHRPVRRQIAVTPAGVKKYAVMCELCGRFIDYGRRLAPAAQIAP